jgi:hypothetical protein
MERPSSPPEESNTVVETIKEIVMVTSTDGSVKID